MHNQFLNLLLIYNKDRYNNFNQKYFSIKKNKTNRVSRPS